MGTHWYDTSGKWIQVVAKKTKPDELKSPDVRDARELGLLPGVTSICDVVVKEGLQKWINGQYILAAATTPQGKGEPDDQWISRVIESANEASRTAADKGKAVHWGAEQFLLSNGRIMLEEHNGHDIILEMLAFEGWYKACCHSFLTEMHIEIPFSYSVGYAGKPDMVVMSGDGVVYDIKTQKTNGAPKKTGYRAYVEWGLQLAAYAYGKELPRAKLVNIIISTDEFETSIESTQAKLFTHEWENNQELYDRFLRRFAVWKDEHNYDPAKAFKESVV